MSKIQIFVEGAGEEEIGHYVEIFEALLKSGGMSGVKGGKTILHFDAQGIFQGIELDYWPWRRRVAKDF